MFISKILIFCTTLFCIKESSINEKLFHHKLNPSLLQEKTKTIISEEKLLEVLSEGYGSTFQKNIDNKKLASAWAHIALENSRGKEVWNFNLGNLGPLNEKQKYYNHKGRGGWPYRAFDSFEESAKAYWETIGKCQLAIQNFGYGNPEEIARGLKSCNYYQSPVEEYKKILSILYSEAYFKIIPKWKK